jgi:hypothetical protein
MSITAEKLPVPHRDATAYKKILPRRHGHLYSEQIKCHK